MMWGRGRCKWSHKRLASHCCCGGMGRNWVACTGPYLKRTVRHYCVSCLSCCCDKTPAKKQHTWRRLCLPYSSRGGGPSWLGKDGKCSRQLVTLLSYSGTRREQEVKPGYENLEAYPLWPTSSSEAPLLEHAIVFPDTTRWRSSVQIHESMGDISHPNHHNY